MDGKPGARREPALPEPRERADKGLVRDLPVLVARRREDPGALAGQHPEPFENPYCGLRQRRDERGRILAALGAELPARGRDGPEAPIKVNLLPARADERVGADWNVEQERDAESDRRRELLALRIAVEQRCEVERGEERLNLFVAQPAV